MKGKLFVSIYNLKSVMLEIESIFSLLLLFHCRVGSSEFIIPIHKFLKSRDYSYSVGMRFRMRFESEDAAERRFAYIMCAFSILILDNSIKEKFNHISFYAGSRD